MIIAAVLLLGLRRLGLAVATVAAAGFWIAAAGILGGSYGMPEPVWVLGATALPLEAVALMAPLGGRRVRWLLRWREGVVLLLAAAAIQLLTLMSDATSRWAQRGV